MVSEEVAKGMIRNRAAKVGFAAAYDQAIEQIDSDISDFRARRDEMRAKLKQADESEEYIEFRSSPLDTQIDLLVHMKHVASQLKKDGWQP